MKNLLLGAFAFVVLVSVPFKASAAIDQLNGLTDIIQSLITPGSSATNTMHMDIVPVGTDRHRFRWDGTPWRVDQGGTGATNFVESGLLVGNGTSPVRSFTKATYVEGGDTTALIVGSPQIELRSDLSDGQSFINVGSGDSVAITLEAKENAGGPSGSLTLESDLHLTELYATNDDSYLQLRNFDLDRAVRIGTDVDSYIDTGFNLGIGTDAPTHTLSVVGSVGFSGLTSSLTGNALCITASNEVTDAGAANCIPSSIRFKEHVAELAHGTGIGLLNQLVPVSFDYKEGAYSEEDGSASLGFIAEEVEKVDSRLVDYGTDGTPLTLHFERITALLVQAVQDLIRSSDATQERVRELEERVAELERLLEEKN